jgi:peptide N-acetyl-beta-D-glucosaminyl asparaginase amidase A
MLPRNAVAAVVEVQASGNNQEEFWYFNLLDEDLQYVPAGTTYGKGSFREVRVLVDGQVAGIVFPYPVLFTGAYIPAVSRMKISS